MISVDRLHLRDFRSYQELDVAFSPGLTVVVGENGNGKTNLVEAIAFLARLKSFRGAPNEALVRRGAEVAVIRGEITCGEREVLIETDIPLTGRMRTQVNKNRLVRRVDLAEFLTVTVFSPDDLEIVKGGPGGRREFVDDLLADLHPKNDAATAEFAKALKQRNALLKQMGGRRDEAAEITLDVWDARITELGERVGVLRSKLLAQLEPMVVEAYAELSARRDHAHSVQLRYASSWFHTGLAAALAESRTDDIRRGVSTVGPHRDDIELLIDQMPARTHASQGEQRSMVLALRLAAHRLVTLARGEAPVLLLDDVFSELDAHRSAALLRTLPDGQKILTSAGGIPAGASIDAQLTISNSTVTLEP